jgi:hypothetical protein
VGCDEFGDKPGRYASGTGAVIDFLQSAPPPSSGLPYDLYNWIRDAVTMVHVEFESLSSPR